MSTDNRDHLSRLERGLLGVRVGFSLPEDDPEFGMDVDLQAVWNLVETFDPQERKFMRLRYTPGGEFTDRTYADIADALGVSLQRVQSIKSRVFRNLYNPMRRRRYMVKRGRLGIPVDAMLQLVTLARMENKCLEDAAQVLTWLAQQEAQP